MTVVWLRVGAVLAGSPVRSAVIATPGAPLLLASIPDGALTRTALTARYGVARLVLTRQDLLFVCLFEASV